MNANASVGMKVEGHRGRCIGHIIDATRYIGTIVKVNKKSIRVNISEVVCNSGEKETARYKTDDTVSYTFWKTTSDGRNIYRSEGRLYGIITL